MIVIVAVSLLFVFGVTLSVVAMRGRRVDDHPVCRRCRYDLTGLADASSRLCPECGVDLSRPRAIAIGNRVRRSRMLAGATIAAGISVAIFGALLAGVASNPKYLVYKPLWWVKLDAVSSSSLQGDALAEILLRYDAHTIPASSLSPVVDDLLVRQANPNLPWIGAAGDFIEGAHARGAANNAQWQRYFDQMVTASAVVRPVMCRGDPIPVHIKTTVRCGNKSNWGFRVGATISTEPSARPEAWSSSPISLGTETWELSLEPPSEQLKLIPDGSTTIPLQATCEVHYIPWWPPSDKAVAVTHLQMNLPIVMKPTSQPTVQPFSDPSQRDAVARSMQLYTYSYPSQKNGLGVGIVLYNGSPVPAAFEMCIRASGREYRWATLACPPGKRTGISSIVTIYNLAAVSKVDFILRPSARAAASDFEMTRYWDQAIVFPDVPVARKFGPATCPAEFPMALPPAPKPGVSVDLPAR
jgi:hypothetical protein